MLYNTWTEKARLSKHTTIKNGNYIQNEKLKVVHSKRAETRD
jgi:hypothetical protein